VRRFHGLRCTESMRIIKYQLSRRQSLTQIKPSEPLRDDLISTADLGSDGGLGSSPIGNVNETGDGGNSIAAG
jgi:hypothetical protein